MTCIQSLLHSCALSKWDSSGVQYLLTVLFGLLLFINLLANSSFSIQANPDSHVISVLRGYFPSVPSAALLFHTLLINPPLLQFHKLPSF